MKLKTVKYQCSLCNGIMPMKFKLGEAQLRKMMMTCRRCNRYALVRAVERLITGNWK